MLHINVDDPPLSEWNATGVLDLWLREKKKHIKRVNQSASTSRRSTGTVTVDDNSDQEES